MNKIAALVLVGGEGKRLKGLTINKAKPYVSFFGKYRLIDFTLSSLSFSHINDVSLITQYQPHELIKYVGNGSAWDLNADSNGIAFLTPHSASDGSIVLQKGTANAILSELDYIKNLDVDYILILSGDQVYKEDFKAVLDSHIKNKASLTILSYDLEDKKELSRFGILEIAKNGRITGFEEKPLNPKSSHISMGIYLFNKDTLLKYITLADKLTDFGRDLVPYIISQNERVFAYKHNSIFFDLGTVDGLYNSNMYFLDNHDKIKNSHEKKIYSKPMNYPPHLIKSTAIVKNSIIADGALIKGSVTHSVISFDVYVGLNTKIKDSVILPGCKIEDNSTIINAIIDEDMLIPSGTSLVFSNPTLVDRFNFKDGLFNE